MYWTVMYQTTDQSVLDRNVPDYGPKCIGPYKYTGPRTIDGPVKGFKRTADQDQVPDQDLTFSMDRSRIDEQFQK